LSANTHIFTVSIAYPPENFHYLYTKLV